MPIFPKMADGQEEAGLSSLAALRRENSNMQESFYTSLYIIHEFKSNQARNLGIEIGESDTS